MPCSLYSTAWIRVSDGRAFAFQQSPRRGVHPSSALVKCVISQHRRYDESGTRRRDSKLNQERSLGTTELREPSQRLRSPTAGLSNALLQTAASEASTQLRTAATQASKLTRGFQPRPVGYPPGPAGDSAADMLRDPLDFMESVTQQYGSVVGLVLGGERVILVADAAAAQRALMSKPSIYRKEGTAFFPGSSLAGEGLLVTDGPVWQRQRQLTNPAFRRAAVEAYAAAMASATEHLLGKVWTAGEARDVYADYNELTLNITTNALFGVDMSSSQAASISGAIKVAFDFFSRRAALGFAVPEWLPTPENLQYHAAVAQLDAAVYSIIADRQRHLSAPRSRGKQAKCLLDNLLLAKDEQGEGLSLQALRDQLMTLLVAGQETSAILLGWTTAFMAHHPETQQRAIMEVQQALQGQPPTPENIRDLPILESIVLESLRLRPPAYLVGRCAAQDDNLAGYRVPKGTTILVSPYLLHRGDQAWQDPLSFNPDRWHQYQDAKGRSGNGTSSTSTSNDAFASFSSDWGNDAYADRGGHTSTSSSSPASYGGGAAMGNTRIRSFDRPSSSAGFGQVWADTRQAFSARSDVSELADQLAAEAMRQTIPVQLYKAPASGQQGNRGSRSRSSSSSLSYGGGAAVGNTRVISYSAMRPVTRQPVLDSLGPPTREASHTRSDPSELAHELARQAARDTIPVYQYGEPRADHTGHGRSTATYGGGAAMGNTRVESYSSWRPITRQPISALDGQFGHPGFRLAEADGKADDMQHPAFALNGDALQSSNGASRQRVKGQGRADRPGALGQDRQGGAAGARGFWGNQSRADVLKSFWDSQNRPDATRGPEESSQVRGFWGSQSRADVLKGFSDRQGRAASSIAPQQTYKGRVDSRIAPQQAYRGRADSRIAPQQTYKGRADSRIAPQQAYMGRAGSPNGSEQLIQDRGQTVNSPEQSDQGRAERTKRPGQSSQRRANGSSILSGMGPNGAYVPFGAGPRNCIGTGFAMMEAMLVLSATLQRYSFATAAQNDAFPEATPRITLRPAAVNLKLQPQSEPRPR